MGFFKKLFKKKAGGTLVGNLFRGAGDAFTGGVYSSVFPQPDNVAGAIANPNAPRPQLGQAYVQGVATPPKSKNKLYYILGGVGVVLIGVFAFIFKGGKRSKSRRR